MPVLQATMALAPRKQAKPLRTNAAQTNNVVADAAKSTSEVLHSSSSSWGGVEWGGVEWGGVEWCGVEWCGVSMVPKFLIGGIKMEFSCRTQ